MSTGGPCHVDLTRQLDPFSLLWATMRKWRSPVVCLILAVLFVGSQNTGQKLEDTAVLKQTPMDGVVQESEIKYAQMRKLQAGRLRSDSQTFLASVMRPTPIHWLSGAASLGLSGQGLNRPLHSIC
ncbi:hypothetical protein L798_04566 [Zootermopsis nevadensis]|uniref:Uncharacterized protein n=1 Tax=Zootermopsis nevadensis TaxID=136037 RepID=A0A067RBF5_ZOONE|nr:hypothetical protein L798_04566 [Zootermopsis nevadensis]